MTEFRPVDPHTDPDWDSFVRASPDGWAWGLAGWQRLIERVPDWGCDRSPSRCAKTVNGWP